MEQRSFGRPATATARRVSRELRTGDDVHLRHRRRVTAWSTTAIASLSAVTLYQMGVLRHLPEPPLPGLDSDAVDASAEAYATGPMPDAALGIASYAVTLCLAVLGGRDRARRRPWIPLALAAKVAADAAAAAGLTLEQGTRHRRFCAYCLVTAVATAASVPHVLPEARAAWRGLRARRA